MMFLEKFVWSYQRDLRGWNVFFLPSNLEDECTEIGEAYVSDDGLIHPEDGFGPEESETDFDPENGCESFHGSSEQCN